MFAPLRSQDPDSRSGYIRENTVATTPPPCSPKIIYVLASLVSEPLISGPLHDTNILDQLPKLGIRPLCESALTDIKNKVTVDNVVSEFFSWVTARFVPVVFSSREVNCCELRPFRSVNRRSWRCNAIFWLWTSKTQNRLSMRKRA